MSERVVAIVQARMGSTRLPGKVLADISGRPMLERVLRRIARAGRVSDVVVATTRAPADDAIADFCARLAIPAHRGSEDDVLDRYVQAARAFHADVIVRITADCPLIDSTIADSVVEALFSAEADFASNTLQRSYPQGLDVEVVRIAALEAAWREATLPHHRSHVLPFVYEHPERFELVGVRASDDHSNLRWTVDTPEDLELVRSVYEQLSDPLAGWLDILELFEHDPTLAEINGSIRQKDTAEG